MSKLGTPDGIKTFKDFWPFYVREHSNGTSRTLHVVGTVLAIFWIFYSALNDLGWWMAMAPVIGYGFAWTGHFIFEKNRPATFRYPLFSFIADFKMVFKTLTGQMGKEVRRHVNQVDS